MSDGKALAKNPAEIVLTDEDEGAIELCADYLDQMEDWMARGYTPSETIRKAQRTWMLEERTAQRLMALVRARWQKAAEAEDHGSRRDRFRYMLHHAYRTCLEMRAMTPSGIEYDRPDMGAAARILDTIGRFEGLIGPGVQVNIDQVNLTVADQMRKAYNLPSGE